jgi:plasmid stability protein
MLLVPLWFHTGALVSNLTLKNIPQDLHAMLKESAARNRRSLNSEILARLERDIAAPKVDRARLARGLKAFTDKLPPVDHRLVDKFKRQGRV